MEPSRFLFVILLVLGCLLIGCAEPAATPEPLPTDTSAPEVAAPTEIATNIPPTSAPTDPATAVPPTMVPTEEPTAEPTPTKTLVPTGTFKGCTYYDGKIIASQFNIRDSDYNRIAGSPIEVRSGCLTRSLPAGTISVLARANAHPDCRPEPPQMEVCMAEETNIEILPGKVTEVDIQLEAPDRSD